MAGQQQIVLTVPGRSGDSKMNRELHRKMHEARLKGQIQEYKNMDMLVDVIFDEIAVRHHRTTNRPYLAYSHGALTQADISGLDGINCDICRVRFKRSEAPIINFKWELTNEEICQLVLKGYYGFNYQYDPEARGDKYRKPVHYDGFKLPSSFFENPWLQIKINADVTYLPCEYNNKIVPLITITTDPHEYIHMTSRKAGYDSPINAIVFPEFSMDDSNREHDTISSYYLPETEILQFDKFANVEAVEENNHKSIEEDERRKFDMLNQQQTAQTQQESSIESEKFEIPKTEEEAEDEARMARLKGEFVESFIESNAQRAADIAESVIRSNVDEIDTESNAHHKFVEDYDEFKPGQTALSAEELEDMHLTQRSQSEKDSKRDKVNAMLRKSRENRENLIATAIRNADDVGRTSREEVESLWT